MTDEPYDDAEEDCGADFASSPVYSNNGYTLDYSIPGNGRRKDDDDDDDTLTTPEPSSILLFLIGFIMILFIRKNKVFRAS